jgi:hypothetical protein
MFASDWVSPSVGKGKEEEGQASLATEIAGMEKGIGDVGVQKGFAKMLDKEEQRLRPTNIRPIRKPHQKLLLCLLCGDISQRPQGVDRSNELESKQIVQDLAFIRCQVN